MSNLTLRRIINEHSPEVAPCSNHRKHSTFVHKAVIIKRNKVLAMAENAVGTRSKGSGYSTNTIHAEKAAVKKLGDISQLRGASIFVWRVSRMNVLPSKPCSDCHMFLEKCMREYGLRSVYYTDTILPRD